MDIWYKKYHSVFKLISLIVLVCFLVVNLPVQNALANTNSLQRRLVSNEIPAATSSNISSDQLPLSSISDRQGGSVLTSTILLGAGVSIMIFALAPILIYKVALLGLAVFILVLALNYLVYSNRISHHSKAVKVIVSIVSILLMAGLAYLNFMPTSKSPTPTPVPTASQTVNQPIEITGTKYDCDRLGETDTYSSSLLGSFNLSEAKQLAITFPKENIGAKFYIELCPLDSSNMYSKIFEGDTKILTRGCSPKIYTIPEGGVVYIDLSDFTSLDIDDISNIGGIYFYSGAGIPYHWLNQDANAAVNQVNFTKIEIIEKKKGIQDSNIYLIVPIGGQFPDITVAVVDLSL